MKIIEASIEEEELRRVASEKRNTKSRLILERLDHKH